jgi:hypothetical protein
VRLRPGCNTNRNGKFCYFAKSRATGKKNVRKESEKTNPARTGKDEPIGLKCI